MPFLGVFCKGIKILQKNYVGRGATKNNTGGHLKIRVDWENSNMRGHAKFLGGFEKIEGKAFRGPVKEGCNVGWS